MKEREEQRGKVKQSLFPVSLFGIYIGDSVSDVGDTYRTDRVYEFGRLE